MSAVSKSTMEPGDTVVLTGSNGVADGTRVPEGTQGKLVTVGKDCLVQVPHPNTGKPVEICIALFALKLVQKATAR